MLDDSLDYQFNILQSRKDNTSKASMCTDPIKRHNRRVQLEIRAAAQRKAVRKARAAERQAAKAAKKGLPAPLIPLSSEAPVALSAAALEQHNPVPLVSATTTMEAKQWGDAIARIRGQRTNVKLADRLKLRMKERAKQKRKGAEGWAKRQMLLEDAKKGKIQLKSARERRFDNKKQAKQTRKTAKRAEKRGETPLASDDKEKKK